MLISNKRRSDGVNSSLATLTRGLLFCLQTAEYLLAHSVLFHRTITRKENGPRGCEKWRGIDQACAVSRSLLSLI